MSKKIITISLILVFSCGLCVNTVFAQGTFNPAGEFDAVERGAGIEEGSKDLDFMYKIAQAIRLFSSLLSIAFLVIVIYAGFLWVRGGNDPENITKAQKWIRNGIIGVFVVLSAFAISSTVISSYEKGQLGASADQFNSGGESDRDRDEREKDERMDEYLEQGFWGRLGAIVGLGGEKEEEQ
jgi:hypothetical protein